ncbi:MAG: YfhO family protein, partial [Saprospiraceae bacterium]
MNQIFKKALPHILAVVTFLILNIIYLYPQLEGKVIQQGDIVSHEGMSQEIVIYRAISGEDPLWTNAMFGGMPAYQISTLYDGNQAVFLERLVQLYFGSPIGYFISLMIGFYLLSVLLGINSWLGILGAVAFGFASNHLVLLEAGHMTKIRAIAQFAPIIAGVLLVFRKQLVLGGILFATGMTLGILANHIQMTYYLGIVLAIYVLIEIIKHIKEGDWNTLLKAGAVLSIGLILSIATSASSLFTTYEYSKDTMRGTPILTQSETTKSEGSSSAVNGLAWDYAMQWSNGPIDVFATMVPGVAGGGSSEKVAADSKIAKFFRSRGANIQRVPLYWGDLPVTSGPTYFGIIFWLLFFVGLFLIRGTLKWWFGIAVLLTLLLSMGKHFEFLSRFFFDYVPMYSKFRAPSSMTSVTTLLVPLFGIITLSEIIKNKFTAKEVTKALYIGGGIMSVITLFFALIAPGMFDFSSLGDGRLQQSGWDVDALIGDRKALMRSDAFRSFGLVAIGVGLIWAFVNHKIKAFILIGGVALLSFGDAWTIGKRYLSKDEFVSAKQYASNHTIRPVDQQIFNAEGITSVENISQLGMDYLKKRANYRVLDLSISTFQGSSTSYFHNTIGGYHPAKLQRIQDLIDYHLTKGNQGVMGMLNTKYVISPQGQLQQNPAALGTAWFVESIRKVNTPNEEIEALNNIDPANEAIVLDSEFNNYIGSFDPSKNGSVTLSGYKPNHLTYTTNTTSEQLAVFSEVWYGPDKGWNAYIDGNPVGHIRANYILRSLKVPAGTHTVEFKFEPSTFYLGETISLIASLLLILGLLGFIGFQLFSLYKNGIPEAEIKEQVSRVAPKKERVKPT